ncbi:MAG TPA: hypothetical protein VHC19_00515 [Pirellulales bacterium]|nr:hypothetical protein [Pirellulales bacterium]
MTRSNRSPANRTARRRDDVSSAAGAEREFEPRPFRRRPWFLAATAAALAVWLAFLSLMAWQQWRQERNRPPALQEPKPAGAAPASGERRAATSDRPETLTTLRNWHNSIDRSPIQAFPRP